MLTIHELLTDVNKDIKVIMKPENANNNYLRNVIEHAFIPAKKFALPEGVPPFSQLGISDVEAKGMFWQEARKFSNYCQASPTEKPIVKFRREAKFIQALESLDKKSNDILIAVKEQELDKLFPNITLAALVAVGYLK